MVMHGDCYLLELAESGFSIEEAHQLLLQELMILWEQVFGDGSDYIAAFFDTAFRPEDTLLWLEDRKPVSMLFLLPVYLQSIFGQTVHGRYVYAVATSPHFRGKGYAAALLQEAEQIIAERGERFAVLHPASDSLYPFYRRFGYETAFSCVEMVVPNERPVAAERLKPLSLLEFKKQYQKLGAGRENEVLWSNAVLPFLYQDAQFSNGGAFGLDHTACGLYSESEFGKVLIKDLACEDLGKILPSLRKTWPDKEIVLRISQKKAEKWLKGSVSQPFGMIKYIKEPFDGGVLRHDAGFIGAVLD